MTAGDLAREKLARLQEAWVLETDAARKFRLEKEIEEAKAQVREFGGDLGAVSMTHQENSGVNKSVNFKNSRADVVVTGDNSVINVNASQKSVVIWILSGTIVLICILLIVLTMNSGGKTSNTTIQITGDKGTNISNVGGNVDFSQTIPSRPSDKAEE